MLVGRRYFAQNVLVVEDNGDDADLLRIAAEAAPEAVSFHIVQDGETALAYLKGESQYADRHAHPLPDLVLLVVSLPGTQNLALANGDKKMRDATPALLSLSERLLEIHALII